MSPQSATPTYTFATATATALGLEAAFDGGRLTSDGGLPWLSEAEEALGICAAFAACVPEWRRAHIAHSLETLVRQRVFQIARSPVGMKTRTTPTPYGRTPCSNWCAAVGPRVTPTWPVNPPSPG